MMFLATNDEFNKVFYLVLVIIILCIIIFFLVKQLRRDIRDSKKVKNEVDINTRPIIYPMRRNISNYSFVLSDEKGKILFYSKTYRSFVGLKEKIEKFVDSIDTLRYEISNVFDRNVALFYDEDGEYMGMSTFEQNLDEAVSFVLNCASYEILDKLQLKDDFIDCEVEDKRIKLEIVQSEHGYCGVYKKGDDIILKTVDREEKKDAKKVAELLQEALTKQRFCCIKRRLGYQILFDSNDEIVGFSKIVENKEDLKTLFD